MSKIKLIEDNNSAVFFFPIILFGFQTKVSMLGCADLDALDCMGRNIRGQPNLPFGGLQLILSGDLLQLEPITEEVFFFLCVCVCVCCVCMCMCVLCVYVCLVCAGSKVRSIPNGCNFQVHSCKR